jgi:hypothetical protein
MPAIDGTLTADVTAWLRTWTNSTATNTFIPSTQYTTTATATNCVTSYYIVFPVTLTQPRENEAELAEARRREQELRRREQELERQAEERADRLLQAELTPAQAEEFSRDRCFTLIGQSGRRRYRIRSTAHAQNIECLDAAGKPVERLCAHLPETFPILDSVLAQKLWLEHDEDGFRRIANIRRVA